MSEDDLIFGQTTQIQYIVFDSVLRVLFINPNRASIDDVLDQLISLENTIKSPCCVTLEISVRHADMAVRCAALQGQAYLTEEQKEEWRGLGEELKADWSAIIADMDVKLGNNTTSKQISTHLADALLLSHLEWISDTRFVNLDQHARRLVFAESPLADFFDQE